VLVEFVALLDERPPALAERVQPRDQLRAVEDGLALLQAPGLLRLSFLAFFAGAIFT
jgi:hypothetical protein